VTTAIILCAGASTRFSDGKSNKTLYTLNGKPIFIHSVENFFSYGVEKMVLVVREDEKSIFESFLPSKEKILFAFGGKRRQDSVLNALSLLEEGEKVLIHDGARPLVSTDLIDRVAKAIEPHKCIIPVIPSEDALRIKKNGKLRSIDRERVFRIQTPQGCIAGELRELYQKFKDEYFYDDAAAFEKKGMDIEFVKGNKRNIKITTKEDILSASFFLSHNVEEVK
jgi:2-C-methyl-D-erythritol 4-phosphate cytidylyltransferase